MKKLSYLLMSALCAFSLTACGQASGSASAPQGEEVSKELSENKAASSGNPQDVPQQTVQGSNVLIAYFSFPEDVDPAGADAVSGASIVVRNGEKLGSLEYVAKTIQETIGGDLFRIETVQQYPLDHDPLVDQAADEKARAFRPELATHIENLQQYDTILLGYPNWWGDLPMPVYSFLEEYDLSGKTIIPFVTHGGSGFSGTWDPYGTVKRWHGAGYLLTKGKLKVAAEMGLSFLAYNFRRTVNLLGVNGIMEMIKA